MSMADLEFRKMLVNLGNCISDEELKALTFMCKSFIPGKEREKIQSCEKFFELLEERDKLSPNNLELLKNILPSACKGRSDVLTIVTTFETTHGAGLAADSLSPDLSAVFDFLTQNLAGEHKHFLRSLGLMDSEIDRLTIENSRNVREILHQGLWNWRQKNKNLGADELQSKLKCALQKEGRNDLVKEVEKLFRNL